MNPSQMLLIILCLTSQPLAFAACFSAPTNGVYLALIGWGQRGPNTNEPIGCEERLVWMPFCEGGKAKLWFPLDTAYLLRVRMHDPDGREVPKTSLGRSYGSRFDQLRSCKSTRLQPVGAEGTYAENNGQGTGGFLAAPKDLFEMGKSGIYTMQIEMQMFRYIAGTNADAWTRNPIRFSPIKVRVEKGPDP